MIRGKTVITIAALVGVLTLAACTGGTPNEGASEPATSGGSSDQTQDAATTPAASGPQSGGTFILAITNDPTSLNPDTTTDASANQAACLIYEGLIWVDNSLTPQPALAESWDISSDNTVYTFHLRQGVQWQDGQPFTSADVVWSLTNVSEALGIQSSAPLKKYVTSIEAVDPSTVKITLNKPYGGLLPLLTCKSNSAILPQHLWDGTNIADNPLNTANPVGTGPFTLQTWTAGQSLTYVKNPTYWDAGKPYLDSIVLQVIADSNAALQALQSGEVDAVGYQTAAGVNVPEMVKNSGDKLYQFDYGTMPQADTLMFNIRSGPLADVQVRQAIAYAIDTQSIIDKAYFGLGKPSKSVIALPAFANPDVDLSTQYAYDPDKAKELLAAAGYASGLTLRLAYEPARAGDEAAVQVVRQDLAAVGITVQLQPMEHTVLANTVFSEHDFDMLWYLLSQGTYPDVGVPRFYTCAAIGTQAFTNGSGYCDEQVDQLFATGASGPTPEAQKDAYYQVQQILAGVLNQVNLIDAAFPGVASTRIQGLDTIGADAMRMSNVWVGQ